MGSAGCNMARQEDGSIAGGTSMPQYREAYTGINSDTGDSFGEGPMIRRVLASQSSVRQSSHPDTPYFEPFPAHAGAAANNPAVRQQLLQYAHSMEEVLVALEVEKEGKAPNNCVQGEKSCPFGEFCYCLLNCCVFDFLGYDKEAEEYYKVQSFMEVCREFYFAQINVAYAQPQGIELRIGSRPTPGHDTKSWNQGKDEAERVYYMTAVEDFDPRRYTQAQREQALAQVHREYTQGLVAGSAEHDWPPCQEYANRFVPLQVPVLQQGVPPPPPPPPVTTTSRLCGPPPPPPPPPPPLEAPLQHK